MRSAMCAASQLPLMWMMLLHLHDNLNDNDEGLISWLLTESTLSKHDKKQIGVYYLKISSIVRFKRNQYLNKKPSNI